MTKDQILAALPPLNANDLQAIRAACEHLIKVGAPAPSTAPQNGCTWLYEAMLGVANSRVAWGKFAPTNHGRVFSDNAPQVLAFIESTFVGALANKTKALGVMRYLLGLLADDLRQRGVKPSVGALAVNLSRLPQVFDAAFPGYSAGGIGNLITDRLTKGKRK